MSIPHADTARESARQDNGQFGTQPLAEATAELTTQHGRPCAHCDGTIVLDDNGAGGTVWVHDFGSTVCGDNPPGTLEGDDLTVATPKPVTPTETAELPDGDGVGYLVTPGVIDEGAQAVYCSGAQSLALARQLHDRTGWPVVVTRRIGPDPLIDEENWEGADIETVLYEAHVEHPDGYLVTINGREDTYSASGSEFVDAWEYQRERITDAQILNEFDDLCEQFPEEEWAATFVDPVLEEAGHAGTRKPLTAPPSTNPKAAPFGQSVTLEALDNHFEALTSPENISWDGERSPGEAQAEAKRLNAAYWERRNEIDPKGERAFCTSCRKETAARSTGHPAEHDNELGRECWGGKQ